MRALLLPLSLVSASSLVFASSGRTALASPVVAAAPVLLAAPEAATTRAPEAPFALTSADGTGLKLVSMEAKGVVDDPLAFTELHLTFENPADRAIEGTFRITLPAGAAVSRFAMKLEQVWQEAEMVELQAARRAYEDFLHRRQDPALLEQAAGNEFSARVFPIPAKGRKEIVISWSQELVAADAPYVVPLAGLSEIGSLSVDVVTPGAKTQPEPLHRSGFVPTKDYVVERTAVAHAGVRNGDLVVARIIPVSSSTAPDPLSELTVLVDTSASRALGFEGQVKLVRETIAALDPKTPITVAAFDQTVVPVYEGLAGGFDAEAAKKLTARRALGASNLEKALAWIGARDGKTKRVLIVGDGVATAGATEAEPLVAAIKKLKGKVERIDAIAVGGIRDATMLSHVVTAGLARDGAVIDGAIGAPAIVKKLAAATKSKVAIAVTGASWSWPQTADGIQAGDPVLVYAELPAKKDVAITVDGKAAALTGGFGEVEAPILERAVAKARIDSLLHDRDTKADGPKQREEIRLKIVELSTKERVMSPYTALLVLETDADYARFGINRNALADVLTVDAKGIAVLHRTKDSIVVAKVVPVKRPDTGADAKFKGGKKEFAAVGGDEAKADKNSDNDASAGAPKDLASPDQLETVAAEARPEAPRRSVSQPRPAAANMVPRATGTPASAPAMMDASEESRGYASGASASGGMAAGPRGRGAVAVGHGSARGIVADPGEGDGAGEDVNGVSPWTGTFAAVMDLLAKKENTKAIAKARAWHEEAPGDVMALVAWGTALEAGGELDLAARVYGSIVDLFPARADMRRFAGERLERVAMAKAGEKQAKSDALALAIDTYQKAEEQRADHPASHRLLAFALLKAGEPEKAFEAIERGIKQNYPDGRFAGVDRILREDLGLVGAAWIKTAPGKRADILARLHADGGTEENAPSLRFVLNWETDANDVDFHIRDAKGNHAFYSRMHLASGGDLYADVTTGYGPECFTIRGAKTFPYTLKAHYYSRGPMGFGMGKLEVIDHDGNGNLTFDERPFVVMVDQAFVDMGKVEKGRIGS